MDRPFSTRRNAYMKPQTTGKPSPQTYSNFSTKFRFSAPASICGWKLHTKVTCESYTQKLHAKVTDESYIRKLQMYKYTKTNRPRRVCKSYS